MIRKRTSLRWPRQTIRIFGIGVVALAGLILLGIASPSFSQNAQEASPPPPSLATEGAPASAEGDLELLRGRLAQLLAGQLDPDTSVENLFRVRLDDPAAVRGEVQDLEKRVAEFSARASEFARRIEAINQEALEAASAADGPADEGLGLGAEAVQEAAVQAESSARAYAARVENEESQLVQLRTRLDVAEKRLTYLRRLDEQFSRMTDASLRILPALAKPREALRLHVADMAGLRESTKALNDRLMILAKRSESGMLVGFVSAQRELASDLSEAAEGRQRQVERLSATTTRLFHLADDLEAKGEALRGHFFRLVGVEDRQSSIDELFATHLGAQRRLRSYVSGVLASVGSEELARLSAQADGIVTSPREIGTTGDGQHALEETHAHHLLIDGVIEAEAAGLAAWELAFENELVTLLSELASDDARGDAYTFSGELFGDLRSEIEIAWNRSREGVRSTLAEWSSPGALVTSTEGRGFLYRVAAVLALFGGWLAVRRNAPSMTVSLVRRLVRAPAVRGHVGLLVRWSGLVQAILPAVAGLLALWLGRKLLGVDRITVQLISAILLPYLLYILGRQLLIGATKRLTTGRPALISVPAATLERLKRTYATLGVVIALGFALHGVAEITIGAGRVVSLLDAAAFLWVAVWAVWEAIRWRVPLSQKWATLVPESDPISSEGRAAVWMQGTKLGAVLVPAALFRILITPVAAFVGDRATDTSLFQSIRARLLRRRSEQSQSKIKVKKKPLPEEYLDAFPLYPILGDDDSLIVTRSEILDEVVGHWTSWTDTRADGSVVLVGEKGAGKTTLAAQIALRTRGQTVIEHTVKGKPTTARALVRSLASAFGVEGATDVETLCEQLNAGEDRIVIIDETHNVFLRHVGGYRAYDALVEIVNTTSDKIFWVLIFNSFTWQFLNESRSRAHYFRKLIFLPKWTAEEIQQLIRLRNQRTGFELRFDEVLLSDRGSSTNSFELVEEAEGYFRLLWQSSAGNPRIATQLWLSSLRPIAEKTLGVGLFPEPDIEVLSKMQDDLVFALAAICQHENLTAEELAKVLNLSEGFGRFAIRFLSESKLIEPKDDLSDRFTLSPACYRAVLRMLRSRHLLYD